ncbi:transcriptional regulator, PaaX family protein [Yinghuangia sp. ASG 101]|uniref:PaaX family transcriptional regulator n=1 Tax=Yinghuangia sp. ASG 101 TaxID=2896848 RepID=UPI001E45BF4A|nr:PaaX family transcriptional regulator C-terminal domain-containing protein [Yinghuangia sp. ASG 101]UGQ12804.1 transcriptional regulator, PaaX family protein [Yinghuangia sp. ASG 101]
MTARILAEIDLPREQIGSNPQHLILGLFSDYWFDAGEPLPSAVLVALLGDFGITPVSARAAIGRLARRGVLEAAKQGRRTFYTMAPTVARAMEKTQRRVVDSGTGDRSWDGLWTTVIFSVPDEQRRVRAVLRRRLRFLGYAAVHDGVWMSPHADHEQTVELLESVAAGKATVLRSTVTYAAGAGDPLTAWDLDAIRAGYEEFVAEYTPLLERVARGHVGTAEALVTRTVAKDFWRQIVSSDPELPENLLPHGWPSRAARAVFVRTYDSLGPLAEARVGQLLVEHGAPELAARVGRRTSARAPS